MSLAARGDPAVVVWHRFDQIHGGPLQTQVSFSRKAHDIDGGVLTNLADAGLRSAARNNKATRLLTRPGRTAKSSAKDSSQRAVKLQSGDSPTRLPRVGGYRPAKVQGRSLFVSSYDVLEKIAPFRHGF